MNVNLQTMPATIDLLHVILGATALLLLIALLIRPKKTATSSPQPQVDTRKPQSGQSAKTPPAPAVKTIRETGPESAFQLLALLQSEARFIDFISEDLSAFSDQDIGAAARVVQEGSKKTINDCFTITPIKTEQEETSITVEEGFNPSEIRLTGNVVGQAPFNGTLIHKGWKVTASNLPKLTEGRDASILAPAEVEL